MSLDQLEDLALQLGSDCPFFLHNEPVFASGRGEQIEPHSISLRGHLLRLIHPGIHIPTREAFRQVVPNDDRPSVRNILSTSVSDWRDSLRNDFEDSIFPQYPVLAQIKQQLYEHGALYASLTGSGSALFGIFSAGASVPQLSVPGTWFTADIQL
jgi:4-diphosphocytidyl-2-C-methyl-D-erythritol kinase